MKSLRNADDKAEIVRRLALVRPESQRLWGKMSPHQMVCHLTDGFRMYMGEKRVAPLGGIYPSRVLRWIALWAPMPWPKGFQTMKELDQQGGGGTSPVEFARDRQELSSLLERFTHTSRLHLWRSSPFRSYERARVDAPGLSPCRSSSPPVRLLTANAKKSAPFSLG